ncbi:MAG: phosphonate ABC transporter substrate-binding protein [Pseudomonadota bacterium]
MKHLLLAGVATLALTTVAQASDIDFSPHVDVWRIGILGGENEADRLRNFACFAEHVETRFGVPVELYPATDYAGVMQGLISDNLEAASLGSAGYAGIYVQDPDAVEPLVTNEQIDGSLGYYSVMLVRADSEIETLDDMKGRSLAFADPNSTSGYLVPSFELDEQGYTTRGGDMFFGQVGFSGGHEQGVVAVLNGQYDAAVTWTSGVGDLDDGYSRGNLHKMVAKGALDMDDVRIIWRSNLITNGPTVVRKELPQEVKEAYREFLVELVDVDPECYGNVAGGDANGYVPIEHDFYDTIIKMRRAAQDSRRG